jgi:hypothetical protein
MELDLEITKLNGRSALPLLYSTGRALSLDDIIALRVERSVQKPPSAVKRLSERHKNLARMVAMGRSNAECAAITGYTESRISILKSDPAFKDLVRLYKEETDIEVQSLTEKMVGASHLALDILIDRLEDEPEKFSATQLLSVQNALADRSGHGVSTTSTNLNIHVGLADRLEKARNRIKTINATPEISNGQSSVHEEGTEGGNGGGSAGRVTIEVPMGAERLP